MKTSKSKTPGRPIKKRASVPRILEAETGADLSDEAKGAEESQEIDGEIEGDFAQSEAEPGEQALSIPDPAGQITSVGPHAEPLQRYLAEIRRYPLLSPEEEIALVRRMLDLGDITAAKALVQANLRLVVKIAMEYRSIYANLLDLIQEGNIGLMKAVSKYDPSKGARLGYYSTWWIRSYILKYLLDNFRLVKVGTTQAQKKLFFHLMREKERLEAQGLLPAPKLLAQRLNVKEQEVIEMDQRLSSRSAEVSIDSPMRPTGGESDAPSPSHRDFMVDPHESPDVILAREELKLQLAEALPLFRKTLNEKETRILEERILGEEPKTLQEIADRYGLTRERARQIEAKLMDKLRKFLGSKFGGLGE